MHRLNFTAICSFKKRLNVRSTDMHRAVRCMTMFDCCTSIQKTENENNFSVNVVFLVSFLFLLIFDYHLHRPIQYLLKS